MTRVDLSQFRKPATKKVTIAKAEVGRSYRIRRGSRVETLGVLVEKTRVSRGYQVRFELESERTYIGFAGGATVVIEEQS